MPGFSMKCHSKRMLSWVEHTIDIPFRKQTRRCAMVFAWNTLQEVTSSANEKSPENSVHVCFSHSYAHLIMFTHWKFKAILKQSLLQPYRFIGHILSNFSFLHRIICHVLSHAVQSYLLVHNLGLYAVQVWIFWPTLADAVVHQRPSQDSNDKCSNPCDPNSNSHTSTCAEGSIWMETIM